MKRLLIVFGFLTFSLLATNALADFNDGRTAYNSRDWAKAVYHLRPLAEQGDARAMLLLGNMYARGYGVKRDAAAAYDLYHRSAIAGNGEAMVVTGAMVQQGLGTEKNINTAVAWYRRAALNGQVGGAFFYGLYLYRGNNSPDGINIIPDHPQSYKWMRVAAKSDKDKKMSETSAKIADEIAKELDVDTINKMDAEAAAFKPLEGDALGPIPGQEPAVEKVPEE